jgi:hypothetical protein
MSDEGNMARESRYVLPIPRKALPFSLRKFEKSGIFADISDIIIEAFA